MTGPGALRTTASIVVIMVAAAVSVFAVATQPARAQPDPSAAVGVELTDIDAIVGADRPEAPIRVVARVTNGSDETLTNVVGELIAHRSVTSRLAYQRAVDPETGEEAQLGGVIGRSEVPADDIAPGTSRLLLLEASPGELGLATVAEAQAVHPLQVRVRSDQGDLPAVTTALVNVPQDVAAPVTVAALVDLGIDIARSQDDAELREQVEHVKLLSSALARLEAPVTVSIDNAIAAIAPDIPEIEALLERPRVERILTPYARADLVALVASGMADVAATQVRLGAAAWPRTTARPDRTIMAPWIALDGASVAAAVTPLGADAAVLTEDMLAIDEDRVLRSSPSPVRPVTVPSTAAAEESSELTALVPDPWLTPVLATLDDTDAATIQRLVAETALIYLERPGATEQRGVVLSATDRSSPDGLAALISALDAASWVELETLGNLRDSVAPAEPTSLNNTAARERALPPDYVGDLGASLETLSALTGVFTESDPGLARLREDLYLAASADFRGAVRLGRTLMDSVDAVAGDLLAAVDIVGQPTVTFTDSVGQLPIVVRNTAAVALRVRVTAESTRLRFPNNGVEVELDPNSITTVLFDTEARTPGGTAPVDVTVTDPTGARELATGILIVRIAAYPALALILVVASILVLVLWLIRDLRRRRPRRSHTA